MIRYIVLGSIFYLAFLVVTVPANFVYGYWKEYFGNSTQFSLSNVEGSVWSGRAGSAIIEGQKLQPISWSVSPLSLFVGKVDLNWEFAVPDGYGKGHSGYSLLNGYYLEGVDAWLPMKFVTPYLKNVSALNPAGMLSIKVDELHSDGQTVTAATGKLAWHNAEITIFKPVELGNYELDISQEGDDIVGLLKDNGGPIEANGTFSLTPTGDYKASGNLAVRDEKRKDLKQALRSVGRMGSDGKVKLSQSGNLSNLKMF